MAGTFPPTFQPQRRPSTSPPQLCQSTSKSVYSFPEKDRSLDLTQKLEKKLAKFNTSSNVFKRWLLEIVSWSVSALCMGAIVGIYLHINGRLLSNYATALNCANVLGKIASAALIIPTSEALGQLKWNWFQNSRAVWDFEIFDKASRGPWGAALLLYRTKGRSLAALGALLIVLLLAIDTFFQQVIEYRDQWALDSMTGAIPRIVNFDPLFEPSFWDGYQINAENKEIASALRPYFYSNGTAPVAYGNGTRPNIPLSCPTSRCEWPEYETLAICSKCEDVSSLLDLAYTCLNTTLDWSVKYAGPVDAPYSNGTVCGHFLNSTSDRPVLLAGYVAKGTDDPATTGETLLVRLISLTNSDTQMPEYGTGSLRFKDIRQPIMDAFIASTADGSRSISSRVPPIVTECMLSWCVQTIHSRYEWGTYEEAVVSTYIDNNGKDDPWPWYTDDTPAGLSAIYNRSVTLRPTNQGRDRSNATLFSSTYNLSNVTAVNVKNLFNDIIPSSYTAASPSAEPLLRYFNYGEPWTRKLVSNPWQAPKNQSEHFEQIARTMTNVVRSSADKTMVPGNAYSMKNFIYVRWLWLIFPFTLLLLSLAFLVSTIQKTSRDGAPGIWKTSAMPTLMYGLPEDTREKLAAQTTWNSSHSDTRKMRIKLLPDLGWRVSGQSLLKSPMLPVLVRQNQPPPGWI